MGGQKSRGDGHKAPDKAIAKKVIKTELALVHAVFEDVSGTTGHHTQQQHDHKGAIEQCNDDLGHGQGPWWFTGVLFFQSAAAAGAV